MPDGSRPRKVLGLSFPTEEERIVVALGRCRDNAICAAATAMAIATGDAAEREAEAPRLKEAIEVYRSALGSALTEQVERDYRADCGAQMAAARRFGEALTDVSARLRELDRDRAAALLREAREEVLPALFDLADCILVEAAKNQNAVLDAVQSRNDRLEAMFTEMEKIGRTIRLIALNAAVESARASGASGRAFGIIATEVRRLATEASELLACAKRNLGGEDLVAQDEV